jgi:hypothetical protein
VTEVGLSEWLYSTQVDLDRVGNTFGIITEVDALGNPRRIDLQDYNKVTVVQSKATGTTTTASTAPCTTRRRCGTNASSPCRA